MYIRVHTKTNKSTGKVYTTHSIVSGARVGGKVVTTTELTLWSDFDAPKDQWPVIMNRVEHILAGSGATLWPCSEELDKLCLKIVTAIKEKRAKPPKPPAVPLTKLLGWSGMPYDGVAQVALFAIERIGLEQVLRNLKETRAKVDVARCLVAARMERPDSEAETFNWLTKRSCPLGGLVGLNFSLRSVMELHRTSDILFGVRYDIENCLFPDKISLFNKKQLFYHYDITNTYFEGNPDSPLIKRGHSKDKRSDRPLISLGAITDEQGYIKKSFIFPGNVNESKTLPIVIKSIELSHDIIIIMDKGIATKANVDWLKENGYKYIVANRERTRVFDPNRVTETFQSKSGNTIRLYPDTIDDDMSEVPFDELILRCHSDSQHIRDVDIIAKRRQSYEEALRKLDQRCGKLVGNLKLSYVMRRLGGLDAKYGVSSHYTVEVVRKADQDPSDDPLVQGVRFEYHPTPRSKAEKPGVHSLRTNVPGIPPREIWDAYSRQNDIESVFKTMKSDLGIRPVFHSKESRIITHLFITTLAYQAVAWIRNRLKAHGIHDNWKTIHDCLVDVNCAMALSKESEAAERRGLLPPEVEQARMYLKAIGLNKPARPKPGFR
jgi:hypothetical protein